MAWSELISARSKTGKVYQDTVNPAKRALDVMAGAALHYESVPGNGVYDSEVNMTITPVNNAQLNGWVANVAGFHYALGQPADKATDGWVGFGGRKGQHWLKYRLVRTGYLHYPTRAWDDISGAPTYNRANLSFQANTITLPTTQQSLTAEGKAIWTNIWTTPGGGTLNAQWWVLGDRLRELLTINQAGRTWITNNHPPLTPAAETYFGFVFQVDVSDIPKWIMAGIQQNIEGDFEDGGVNGIELRSTIDELLAFLPISYAYVINAAGDFLATVGLKKRIWFDPDGNVYLLMGARVDQLAGLPNGTLVFDPTIDTIVAAGADDASERDDGTSFTGVSTTMVCDSNTAASSRSNGGARFVLTGPASGDTVTAAYSPIHATTTSTDDPNCDLVFEDVDNAANFTTNADVTSRVRAATSVQWTATSIGTGEVNSPSIVTPLQTIFNRAGWASGNAVVLFYDGKSDINQTFRIDTYEGSTTECAKLHVEYTVPSAGSANLLTGKLGQKLVGKL